MEKNASNDEYFIGYKDRNTHNQWKIIENFPIKKNWEKSPKKCTRTNSYSDNCAIQVKQMDYN